MTKTCEQTESNRSSRRAPDERRRTSRWAVSMPTTVHAGTSHTGMITDVSDRGVFVELPQEIPVGSLVELEFDWPDRPGRLRVLGEISWSSEGDEESSGGVGIQFRSMGEAGLEYLCNIVDLHRTGT